VSTYLNSNTAKDDLEFELLLCLAKILGVIERLEPTGVCETKSRAVFVPTPPNSNATKDNLEFEWLLCLASTLDAIRRRWPTDIGETQRAEGLGDLRMESSLRENPEGIEFYSGKMASAKPRTGLLLDRLMPSHGWNSFQT